MKLFGKRGRITQTGNGKKVISVDPNSNGLDLVQGVFVHSGDMMSASNKRKFSIWAELPEDSWTDNHRKEFSLAIFAHILTARKLGIELPEAYSNILKLFKDLNPPILKKELTSDIRNLFNSLVSD